MAISNAVSGFGTLLYRGDGGTQSSLATGAGDNGISWLARDPGVAGDSITVELVLSGVQLATSVGVAGTDITVTLRSADGIAVDATAQEVIDAVRGFAAADALVVLTPLGNGTGVVAEVAQTALSGGADEIFQVVAEVTNLSGPGLSMDTIETTHMQSNGAFREYIASLKDPGSVSIDLNFLPSNLNQQGFIDDFLTRVRRNFRIDWPDALARWGFGGFVVSFEPSAAIDDKLSASSEIKVTGEPTFTTQL